MGCINIYASRWLSMTNYTHTRQHPQQYPTWQWNCQDYIRKRGNLQQFVCNCERKPDVILLQETNDQVKLAGYKAIDAAASNEEQRKRRRRVASTGVGVTLRGAAVLVRRNLTVAERELQGVQIPHVLVEMIPSRVKDYLY